MEKRLIFPVIMFVTAGVSFAFGIWQYASARLAQQSADRRMAYIMTTIARSELVPASKQRLYASIAGGLPAAPTVLGLDFSGSFASQESDDHCANDGQQTICRVLRTQGIDPETVRAVCGVCNPR